MKQNVKKIVIGCTMFVLVLLLGLAGWLILDKKETTEGEQIAKNELGIEWYDENETEFTITTAEQLYEFAQLSTYYDFAGQTVYLGADIVVNEGDADDWAVSKSFPKKNWQSIYGFAGTFDGQGHTISGIYCFGYLYSINRFGIEGTDYVTAGLFRNTQEECVIKNFKLVNSFFDGDLNWGVGCISSYGGGTFDTIYTDGIIISQKNNVGGILGRAVKNATITNCWFDGSVDVVGGYGRFVGGIVGRIYENAEVTIEHCLVSADMSSDLYKRGVNMGGLVGQTYQATATIQDCLVSGKLYNDWQIVGSVIGNLYEESEVTMADVYATSDSWTKTLGHTAGIANGTPVKYEREKITGYGGYQWTTLDFENYWAVVEGGTPVLKSFAENALSLDSVAKMIDVSWYNEDEDTFILNDKEDLYGFALLSYMSNFEGKTVKLGADITINEGKASSWAKAAPELEWMCIGSAAQKFEGTFDGQMHTISGIYLSTEESYSGLFGMTGDGAVIKNLKLTNSYFESTAASLGSIAGRGVGTFDTIYSNAIIVSSNGNVGGMIGQVTAGKKLTINNCWFDGSVKTTANVTACRKIGGLLGFVLIEAHISNCLNTGTIDASIYNVPNSETSKHVQPYVGGFIGQIHPNGTATLSNCLNVGEVKYNKAATTSYGAIIGTASGTAELSHVYATKESCGRMMNGYITGQTISYNESQLIGYGSYQWTTLNFQKYWAVVEGDTAILKSFAKKVPSLSGVARMVDISWYDKSKDTYIIDSVEDLYGFYIMSFNTDFTGKTVKLGADITINTGNAADWATNAPTYSWNPIGNSTYPFQGTFDGQGHTISGLYRNSEERWCGLFAVTGANSVVKNLKLTNSYFKTTLADCGSIAGVAKGTFDTVYSDAIVVANSPRIGGLAGQGNGDVVMNNCWFAGTVTNTGNDKSSRATGGLLGLLYEGTLKMTNCLNTGTIDVSFYTLNAGTEEKPNVSPLAGGLVGHLRKGTTASISDSLATGKVVVSSTATSGYGAAIGYVDDGATANVNEVWATTASSLNTHKGTITKGGIVQINEDRIKGVFGYQFTLLDFDNYWAAVDGGTPVLKSFANGMSFNAERMIDISWYDESKDTYTLTDEKDLYGFSMLSALTDFAGKTIKLGETITVNKDMSTPTYSWISIGSTVKPFAGTFDGQMNTIKGLYLNTSDRFCSLFAVTSSSSVIKNLKVTDSKFESSAADCASMVGRADGGKIDTVYSSATVTSSAARVGGMIGMVNGDVTINNSWFDGTVTNTSNKTTTRGTGGFVGSVYSGSLKLSHVLNSGTVDVSVYTAQNPNGMIVPTAGGFVGIVEEGKSVAMSDSLSVGDVLATSGAKGYGPTIGYCDLTDAATTSYVYATSAGVTNNMNASVLVVDKDKIKGYGGYQYELLDLNFNKYWAFVLDNEETTEVDESGTPILQSFKDMALKVGIGLDGVDKLIDTDWYYKATADAQGNVPGSEKNPYIISDRAELNALVSICAEDDFAGKFIRLGADIIVNTGDASDWAKKAPTYTWSPIGSSSKPFAGTFDGSDPETGKIHTISGIYLNASSECSGLFAATATGSAVKNLKLTNSYFTTTYKRFGSVVGWLMGNMENIYCDAIVTGNNQALGGLVGIVGNSKNTEVAMANCWFDGTVTNTSTNQIYTGGLIGHVYTKKLTLTDCLNSGTVDTTAYTTNNNGKIVPYVGGFIGRHQYGTLEVNTSVNLGTVLYGSATHYRGAIVGYTDVQTVSMSSVYYTGRSCTWLCPGVTIPETNYTKVDYAASATWSNLDLVNKWTAAGGRVPVLKTFEDEMVDTSWYYEATVDLDGNEPGSEKNPYILYDKEDLYGFTVLSQDASLNGFAGKFIRLGADIVVNKNMKAPNYDWIPIGSSSNPFKGTFDGADLITKDIHTISGIYLKMNGEYGGLFAATADGSMVKNLKLTNSSINSPTKRLGSIVGLLMGDLDTVYSNATVTGNGQAVGGLVAVVGNSKNIEVAMNKCWYAGTVTNQSTSGNATGGLVGHVYTKKLTLTDCLNTNTVDASAFTENAPCVGGLVGYHQYGTLKVDTSVNLGTIKYNSAANNGRGGIVGYTAVQTVEMSGVYYMGCTWLCPGATIPTTDYTKVNNATTETWSNLSLGEVWEISESGTPILTILK